MHGKHRRTIISQYSDGHMRDSSIFHGEHISISDFLPLCALFFCFQIHFVFIHLNPYRFSSFRLFYRARTKSVFPFITNSIIWPKCIGKFFPRIKSKTRKIQKGTQPKEENTLVNAANRNKSDTTENVE